MQTEENSAINLFVYGTLLRGFANSSFLQQPFRARFIGEGTVRGYLYDAGSFPAFIPAAAEQSDAPQVAGEIYRIDDPDLVLETLDTIEGYNTSNPERSLYIRKQVMAECAGEKLPVMVYVYNLPVDGLPRIESGDYRQYVRSLRDTPE